MFDFVYVYLLDFLVIFFGKYEYFLGKKKLKLYLYVNMFIVLNLEKV